MMVEDVDDSAWVSIYDGVEGGEKKVRARVRARARANVCMFVRLFVCSFVRLFVCSGYTFLYGDKKNQFCFTIKHCRYVEYN